MKMMFSRTNRKTNPLYQPRQQPQIIQKNNNNMILPIQIPKRVAFSFVSDQGDTQKYVQRNGITRTVDIKDVTEETNMKWGKYVWTFLHTIACKIKEDEFVKVKDELLRMIYSICINLPCPYCSDHAKIYLDSINFTNIKTKESFSDTLYLFHNNVNTRKQYKLFSKEDLESTYGNLNIVNVFNDFIIHFHKSSGTLMFNSLQKSRVAYAIKNWIQQHIDIFE
jgi:hydrogenase maturation factor